MKKLYFIILCFIQSTSFCQRQTPLAFNIYVEEDNFNSQYDQDRNYTGGGAITLTGHFTNSNWFVASYFRKRLDGLFHVRNIFSHYFPSHNLWHSDAFTFGTSVFTPRDIAKSIPIIGDRPYASLTFISSKNTTVYQDKDDNDNLAVTTELNLGMLGTHLGDSLQTWIHRSGLKKNPNNRPIPLGWKNQISNGGEPTAMYRLSVQQKLAEAFLDNDLNLKAAQLSSLYECQLGYYTNIAVGVTLRLGYFNTNFWQNNSNFGNSGNQVEARSDNRKNTVSDFFEIYGFVSARSRLIMYNSLLQGQFKKSIYTLGSKEINHLVSEFEIGIAARLWRFTFTYEPIAGRTSELNTAYSRNHIWGAFNFAYSTPFKNN